MQKSGLLTIANHSHSHAHMLDQSAYESEQQWLAAMRQEVKVAEKILQQNTGSAAKIFAYPYGETNTQLQQMITALGYSAVGQQSGAIGNSSDLSVLPRFPLSGAYANMETLADKLLSLPLPIVAIDFSEAAAVNEAPLLSLQLEEGFDGKVQCYLGSGEKIATEQKDHSISVFYSQNVAPGRHRYNCTAPSTQPGRFYWYSHQWLQQ